MKSPTFTMRGPGPRLSYDATVSALAAGGIDPAQHLPLWQLIVAQHLSQWKPKKQGVRCGRPGWTLEAASLLTPLRRLVQDHRGRRNKFHQDYRGLYAVDKQGNQHLLTQVYDDYIDRCNVLRESMRKTLGAFGHLSNDVTASLGMTLPELVADLRAQGRPAGCDHWSQWEDPATVRRTRYLLGQMFDVHNAAYGRDPSGRRWYAYEHGLAEQRAREEWDAALKQWRFGAVQLPAELSAALDTASEAWTHWIALLNANALRSAFEDTMHAQRAKGRTPKSYPTGEAWRALPLQTRAALAHAHQAVLDELIAAGELPPTTVTHYAPDESELSASGLQA